MPRKYYAISEGRVDKPIIYSSWAQVHPRVSECENDHKEFKTQQEAVEWIKEKDVPEHEIETIFRDEDRNWEQPVSGIYYYAVPYGRTTGVFRNWKATEAATKKFPSACYQKFDTEHEAKRFIAEWKDAYADVWRRAIRKGLDEGLKPEDLKVDIGRILNRVNNGGVKDEDEESICSGFEDLGLGRRDPGVMSRSLV